MTALSKKHIAEIEGRLYMASRLPQEKKSAAFSEILQDLKKMIAIFEKDRGRHLDRVKRCLKVLLALLESGHVVIQGSEDREVFEWVKKEARRIIYDWDE